MKGRKTGGRKKGTKNKRDQVRAQIIEAALPQLPEHLRDISPLEAMLICMKWSLQQKDRAGILAAAAPFCHARLTSAEVRVTNPASGMTDEELKAEIALLERRIKGDETVH
jgi:hypothetical protein